MIQLYKDFIDFLLIRRLVTTSQLNETHKLIIRSYNKEYEKEMNSLILHKLGEEMVAGSITPDYYRGFRSALTWRIAMMGLTNSKFPINNNNK